jgi:membrane-bound ClpP family serine protease
MVLGPFATGPVAWAEEPVRARGLLVSVENPITGDTVTGIRNKIDKALDVRANRGAIKAIIFDFNPQDGKAATPDFEPCLALARYLRGLKNRTRTVAFVHGPVTRHTVLPVLACTDLIMKEGSEIGDVRGDKQEFLDNIVLSTYQDFARLKNPDSPDLVLKMLDKDMEVWRTQAPPVRYVARQNLKEAERDRFRKVDNIPSLQRGSGRFVADDAFKCGLCKAKIDALKDVAFAEGLSESSLREGIPPGLKNAWLIDFTGSVTAARVSSVRRKIDKAIARGANLIILQIDCEGGDPQAASDFAYKYLRTLKDDRGHNPVYTVAYVPPGRKLEAASFLALGCTEIVMGKGSALCHFSEAEATKSGIAEPLVELARKRGHIPLLIKATVDPDLVLYLVQSRSDPTNNDLVTEEQWKKDEEKPAAERKMARPKLVKHKGDLLELTAKTAYDYDLARLINPDEVEDVSAVYRHYALDPAKVQHSGSDFLDTIEEFFRRPEVSFFLIVIGIIGLILEMKMPGLGIPGVVAAVCFVLYFWANSSVGEFWWLAVLLFVLGLILIGLEVFFLPGMAVFGISGVVLVVTSLVLVTLEKAPATTADWVELGGTLTMYTLALLGAIAGAFVIARYLPQIPYANRLVLVPPSDRPEPPAGEGRGGATAAAPALLGAIGEAATNLRPAGKARFGDDFLDVVAEGSYVTAGQRVQVIEIEGNRIVVKEV